MDGKVVVITGASRGIGAAAAQVFAAAGAKVALLARSSAEIDALAAEIGPQAMAHALSQPANDISTSSFYRLPFISQRLLFTNSLPFIRARDKTRKSEFQNQGELSPRGGRGEALTSSENIAS